MSRTPRSVEPGQFDSDSPNERVDTEAVLAELERLTSPEKSPLDEFVAEIWRKDNIKRILARIKATVSDIDHFLKNPQTRRLFSKDATQEQRERDYVAVKERVETLKTEIDMAKDDIQELVDTYHPGLDSDGLGEAIEKLKKQLQLLEIMCNGFF